MTTRLEDLEAQLADIDPKSERAKTITSEIEAEKAKTESAEDAERRLELYRLKERQGEVETAIKAAAPEKAVKRTTTKKK